MKSRMSFSGWNKNFCWTFVVGRIVTKTAMETNSDPAKGWQTSWSPAAIIYRTLSVFFLWNQTIRGAHEASWSWNLAKFAVYTLTQLSGRKSKKTQKARLQSSAWPTWAAKKRFQRALSSMLLRAPFNWELLGKKSEELNRASGQWIFAAASHPLSNIAISEYGGI